MAHDDPVDTFRDYLAEQGLRMTRQRRAIVGSFFGDGGHLSLPEVLDLAKRRDPGIGYATVYRTMKLLAESGLATEHDFGQGHVRYEPRHEGEHHDHLVCLGCGNIVEFEDPVIERRQAEIARDRGFRVTSHRHVIYGSRCPRCAR